MKVNPEEYLTSEGRHQKFGKVRDDGTIEVPNNLTLKWIPNYYFRMTEYESTRISFGITILFCSFGLILV